MTYSTIPEALHGKVAIVTGASRGIGRAIAETLAAEGASLIINYARNLEAADEVVQGIVKHGGHALAVQANMGDLGEIEGLFTTALNHFGALDILVNNAGTGEFKPLVDVMEAEYDRLFAINTKGVFFAMQHAARHLRNDGRIINISSGITVLGGANGTLYAGTKGAVEQFTLAAAKELASRGITVNTVSPGFVESDLLNEVMPRDVQAAMAESAPLGRLGRPQDIADMVAFLVSEKARWVTGQNIRANGGMA